GIRDRPIDQVQVGASTRIDRRISWHAQLHVYALKQRLSQFEHARAKGSTRTRRRIDCEVRLCRGHSRQPADTPGPPSTLQRPTFSLSLVRQPRSQIGVVVRSIQRLLEPPVKFLLRRCPALHLGELGERYVYT